MKICSKKLHNKKKVDNGICPRKKGRQRCFTVDLIFNAPKDANLGFWKIGPAIALYVGHLHYNTEKVWTRGLAGGSFSIHCQQAFQAKTEISEMHFSAKNFKVFHEYSYQSLSPNIFAAALNVKHASIFRESTYCCVPSLDNI